MVSNFDADRNAVVNNIALSDALKDLSLGNVIAKEAHLSSMVDAEYAKARPMPLSSPSHLPKISTGPNVGKTVNRRASTPALNKKTSMSSLHNKDLPSTPKRVLSRRSSGMLQQSPVSSMSPRLPTQTEDHERLTEEMVAAQWFKKDLAQHEAQSFQTETVVILHDSCYGHRYSRPRTNKATLSMIVERPERVQASVVGVSAAYIRLGERHVGGLEAPHPKREPSLSAPFKIQKSTRFVDLGSPAITSVHGTKWMEELKGMCQSAETKLATTGRELARSSGNAFEKSPKARLHEGDLYLCSESLNAFQGALGGVCDGVDAVFGPGTGKRAFVCVRPPGHHCSSDYPSGFCWLNNVHAGIQHAAQSHGLTHAAIIDFDLHHGDGSQSITWQHNARAARLNRNAPISKKVPIGYFSLHDINSYPCEEGDEAKVQSASLCVENAHGQTVWNVHLQPWKTMDEFWELYRTRYCIILDKVKAFLKTQSAKQSNSQGQPPKSAIFISAGFDASEWETADMQRHKINVPTDFYAQFTRDIVCLANEAGLGVDGRVISVLEGGYSDRALISGVFSHLAGMSGRSTPGDVKSEIQSFGDSVSSIAPVMSDGFAQTGSSYDSKWWKEALLDELDEKLGSANTIPAKARNTSQSTFFAPTQSSTAKAVDPTKITRSVSISKLPSPTRSASPPPPEVTWSTATHELSKMLVPSDRQTRSCLPEELADIRPKREKSSPAKKQAEAPAKKMQLRVKKPRKPSEEPADALQAKPKPVSRATRRRTIAELQTMAEENAVPALPAVPKPRRLSVASSVASTNETERNRSLNVTSVPAIKAAVPGTKANDLNMKKTRAPSQRRIESLKSTNEGSKTPSTKAKNTKAGKLKSVAKSAAESLQARSSSSGNEEVDGLASMMKKITIRVPAGQKYADLQKQVASEAMSEDSKLPRTAIIAQANIPISDTSRVSGNVSELDQTSSLKLDMAIEDAKFKQVEPEAVTPTTSNASQPVDHDSVPQIQTEDFESLTADSMNNYQNTRIVSNTPSESEAAAIFSSQPSSSTGPHTPPASTAADSSPMQFIAYEPEGQSDKTNVHNEEQQQQQQQQQQKQSQRNQVSALPLHWLPPNTGTPAPASTPVPPVAPAAITATAAALTKSASAQKANRQGLPKFTATGHIPFGDGGVGHGSNKRGR